MAEAGPGGVPAAPGQGGQAPEGSWLCAAAKAIPYVGESLAEMCNNSERFRYWARVVLLWGLVYPVVNFFVIFGALNYAPGMDRGRDFAVSGLRLKPLVDREIDDSNAAIDGSEVFAFSLSENAPKTSAPHSLHVKRDAKLQFWTFQQKEGDLTTASQDPDCLNPANNSASPGDTIAYLQISAEGESSAHPEIQIPLATDGETAPFDKKDVADAWQALQNGATNQRLSDDVALTLTATADEKKSGRTDFLKREFKCGRPYSFYVLVTYFKPKLNLSETSTVASQ